MAPTATTSRVRVTGSSADMSITAGPSLIEFLDAALKGGSGVVEFEVRSRLRTRTSVTSTKVTVEIHKASCEDGSGALFIFEGTLRGRQVKGFYNAKNLGDSPSSHTGSFSYC